MARDMDEASEISYKDVMPDLVDLEEVKYELLIRGIEGISSSSEMRRAFRNFLSRDQDPETSVIQAVPADMNRDTEYRNILELLDGIKEELANKPEDEHTKRRAASRLALLRIRTVRNARYDTGGTNRFEKLEDEIIERYSSLSYPRLDRMMTRLAMTEEPDEQTPRYSPSQAEGAVGGGSGQQRKDTLKPVSNLPNLDQWSTVGGFDSTDAQSLNVRRSLGIDPGERRPPMPSISITDASNAFSDNFGNSSRSDETRMNGKDRNHFDPLPGTNRFGNFSRDNFIGRGPDLVSTLDALQERYRQTGAIPRTTRVTDVLPTPPRQETYHPSRTQNAAPIVMDRERTTPLSSLGRSSTEREGSQLNLSQMKELYEMLGQMLMTRDSSGPGRVFGGPRSRENSPDRRNPNQSAGEWTQPPRANPARLTPRVRFSSESEWGDQTTPRSTNRAGAYNPPQTPVSKWKITKFTGNEDDLPRFISTVTQYAIAEGASKEEVFRNRVHLLAGDAADFVALSTHIHDWDDLVEELTRYCLGSTSDTDLLRRIERKRQGTESCAVYCTRMELMFRSLRQPLPEQEKVDIIIRGMKPEIRQSLAGIVLIRDVHELQLAAQRVEKLLFFADRGHHHAIAAISPNADATSEKPNRFSNQGGRNFSVPSPNPRGGRQSPRPFNEPRGRNPPNPQNKEPNRENQCFRCGLVGHYGRQCNVVTNSPVCYGCGEPGVVKPNCPNCSGNGPRQGQ